jgi:hypothetical protein
VVEPSDVRVSSSKRTKPVAGRSVQQPKVPANVSMSLESDKAVSQKHRKHKTSLQQDSTSTERDKAPKEEEVNAYISRRMQDFVKL